MKDDEIDSAFDMTGQRTEVPSEREVAEAEKAMGIVFPMDYKRLLEVYGSGSLEDFFWLLNPVSTTPGLVVADELRTSAKLTDIARRYGATDVFLERSPMAGGLFPWGTTFAGDTLYWRTDGAPEAWGVVVRASREPVYHGYDVGCFRFLMDLFHGQLECPVFPDLVIRPWRKPRFTPIRRR
jgi:hypothetical protein